MRHLREPVRRSGCGAVDWICGLIPAVCEDVRQGLDLVVIVPQDGRDVQKCRLWSLPCGVLECNAQMDEGALARKSTDRGALCSLARDEGLEEEYETMEVQGRRLEDMIIAASPTRSSSSNVDTKFVAYVTKYYGGLCLFSSLQIKSRDLIEYKASSKGPEGDTTSRTANVNDICGVAADHMPRLRLRCAVLARGTSRAL